MLSVRLRELHEAQAQEEAGRGDCRRSCLPVARARSGNQGERKQEHEEKKDAVDRVLDVAKEAKEEKLDYARLESEERRAGAKIGADLVTFGQELESKERQEGIKLGKQITEMHPR